MISRGRFPSATATYRNTIPWAFMSEPQHNGQTPTLRSAAEEIQSFRSVLSSFLIIRTNGLTPPPSAEGFEEARQEDAYLNERLQDNE